MGQGSEGGGLQVPGPKYRFLGTRFWLSGIDNLKNMLSDDTFWHPGDIEAVHFRFA